MKLRWLTISLVVLILLSSGAVLTGQAQATTLQVASGDTTQSETVLWAWSSTPGTIEFVYSTQDDFSSPTSPTSLTATTSDPAIPVKVMVKDLAPGTRYYYRATDAAGTVASGTFRTANASGTQDGLRFGVTGDWRQDLAPYPAIKNVEAQSLDFMVLLGDTIYADYSSPAVRAGQARTLEQYRAKHAEALSERHGLNTWRDVRAAVSVMAMIDDHEVINDFAGGASPTTDRRFERSVQYINQTQLYRYGLQAFQEYMPIREEVWGATNDPRVEGRPKLYRAVTYGDDALVILVDARSFRDTPLRAITSLTNRDQRDAFLRASYDPKRTMLGIPQLEALKADLLEAHNAGITWKFLMVPEPVQNFGPIAGEDRFEGYAAERADLLKFIHDNGIKNVVFVAADLHGTMVNNLYYQEKFNGSPIHIDAWEIITGAVAFDAPFGPTLVKLAADYRLISASQKAIYDLLPTPGKDAFVKRALEEQFRLFDLDPLGLQGSGSGIDATLNSGDYIAVHTYGWTEFEIAPGAQTLRVTTYGITPYTQQQMEADPSAVTGRTPVIVSQFTVKAKE